MSELMSNFDNLEDTIEDKMGDNPGSNTDMTQTVEYSVDVREIKTPHRSRAYKKTLGTFKARLKSQLERVQRKRFDSDDSSADETTLDWLERLRRNRMRNPSIMPQDDSVNDDEDSEGNGIDMNSLQRYTNLQSVSANIDNDKYRGFQVKRQDLSESESEPTQRLLSRRDDEESRSKWGRNAETEQRMVAETIRSMDSSPVGERKGGKGKQIKSSKECELKRVVKVKDQGRKTLRLYQKHEMDQNKNLTTKEAIEIVEDKHTPPTHGTQKLKNTSAKLSVPAPLSKQQQSHREVMPTSGTIEESEDTDAILSHVQQLYSSTPDQNNLAVHSRDIDEKSLMDIETEAEEGNSRHRDDVPADVKMFGKINGGKRRFAKRAHRRAHLQATSSSSENDTDSKDSLDKMLQKIKILKKEHCESSSSTDATSSLLRRQTVRLVKRFCKRSRETSEMDTSGGANGIEDSGNGATTLPSRKRPKRSTSPDIEVEETVQVHIKKIGKGSTYTRRYFQKRHRIKHFGKQQNKKEKVDCRFGSKRYPVAGVSNGPSDLEDTDAGPSKVQSDRNPMYVSADDRPLLISNEPKSPDCPQGKQDSHQTSAVNRSPLPRPNPQKTLHEGRAIRLNDTPSFFLLPKDQAKPQNSMQMRFRILNVLVIFVFIIIAMSFLIRFLFLCNPVGRCSRCDIEFALYKFIDSHSGLRHMKRPPI